MCSCKAKEHWGWLLPASTRSCEEARKESTQPQGGTQPCQHLVSDLQPPELRKNNFLYFFKATQFERLSYGSSRKEAHLDTQQKYVNTHVVIVQSPGHVRRTPGLPVLLTISPESAQVHVHCMMDMVMLSSHLHPLMLLFSSAFDHSSIRRFPNESAVLIR